MATIEMKKAHTIGKAAARTKAEEIADSFKERLSIEWAWSGDVIDFKSTGGTAKGTKGKLIVTDTSIAIEIDLPFMLRPLKGMVEGKIKEKLEAIS